MILVYSLTTIIVAAWLMKMVAARQIVFRRTFLDIPLLCFFTAQLASFLFSIDRHTSLWGYYSRFHGGLLSTITYLFLYWAYVSNIDRRQTLRAIRLALASATLVASYGILEHFGIDAKYWVQDVRNRVFSTLGQPNWLAAYLVALIPLTWALALRNLKKSRWLMFGLLYLCLLYTKSRSGFLGFAASYFVFWLAIFWRQRKLFKKPFQVFSLTILILSLLVGTPWTPLRSPPATSAGQAPNSQPTTPSDQPPLLISESSDIRKIVWQGAVEIWKHYPLFGTGPETFAYSYYWFRPREHNDLSEWDFLYNKAHNEYLNFAATTGTVGLIGYLGLIGAIIFWFAKSFSKTKKPLTAALLAGFASILVTNFFGFSVVAVALFFFLFPAINFTFQQPSPKTVKPTKKFLLQQWLAIIVIFLATVYCLLFLGRYWYADTRFARGERLSKAGQPDEAFNVLQEAVLLRPDEPFFHDQLALAGAQLAVLAHQQENASLSAQLVQMAVSESDKTLNANPYHLNFWKNRTKIFYNLKSLDENYLQEALAALLRATTLAPTDAKVKYNLGLLYAQLGQNETAIEILEETLKLKPNYEEARQAKELLETL